MAKIKLVDSQDGGEQSQVLVLEDGTEIGLDEVDGGFLRQSDYTTKTQALAAERKALQSNTANHQVDVVAKSQAQGNNDVANMTKMYLDTKMTIMKNIYGEDFDEVAVLNEAVKQLESGTAAPSIDFDKIHKAMAYDKIGTLEEKVRAKILKELEAGQIDTSSIISSGDGTTIKDDKHGLTAQEIAYCRKTGTSLEDYAKYK